MSVWLKEIGYYNKISKSGKLLNGKKKERGMERAVEKKLENKRNR